MVSTENPSTFMSSASLHLLVVSDNCCPEVKREFHISGDIAFAVRQYISATRDFEWLKNENGSLLVENIAKFWLSAMTYNQTKQKYEINGNL